MLFVYAFESCLKSDRNNGQMKIYMYRKSLVKC